MKELERLEKRIDRGGKLAALGAILSFIGLIASLVLAYFNGPAFMPYDIALIFTGPIIFGIGVYILPSRRELDRARLDALWQMRMKEAIKERQHPRRQ